MSSLRDCYATVTTEFGAGGSMYIDGHRGTDYRRGGRQAIIAYDDMIVESRDHGTGLGWSIGLRRLTQGGFCGYAHVYGAPPVGARFAKGDVIALVAGYNDDHGTLWTGPHIHTTQGAISAYNCSVGIRPLSDPAPVIARAITGSSTAGGSSKPIPPAQKEEQPMYGIRRSANGQVFAFAAGYVKYHTNPAGATASMLTMNPDGKWIEKNEDEFIAWCANCDVPMEAVNVITAKGAPITVWSRARQAEDRANDILTKLR